ncbi:ABC superfamily ATP binding cassette transporter, membrane protein [Lactobacillus pasteurii DSM 23907 = CRBIP 24.76]|uniref:Putative hemin transport system permease protein HrtB n=1 Tax=Lactobacillus pasteurii DSM 23907 = CRBIP 24.76 TaxID=1423790 RepID=I7JX46_9LACO|nr:ABC transporter permease [Lactobacillus pasteurii]KRK07877.1 ABC superfamily ATP binding cassette transporter, membrane protein [Lactobacillus pasteurii DSM 23907 = CRBIP 24.76]TDG77957.1 hypothetical protein C5L33_001762 [Lactobacillus pasteurii]CCI84355.1 ABC superfamily ATP binding cassette transporter, membrane protein [Lactobacillus pasteurii DSM 23907 = CRBIP 24.76]
MFLAFKEIKHEKIRYGLIVMMIFLISYLIFMLSSLAIGLAEENTQALESWQTQKVVLNKNANISLSQSVLNKDDLKNASLSKNEAYLGQVPVVVKANKRSSISAQFLGVKRDQFIYQDQELIAGRKSKNKSEVTADQALQLKGYKLGDKIKLNDSKQKYTIVGFVKNAKINIAPIIYGDLATWKKLKVAMPNVVASGIISKNADYKLNHKNAKTYDVKTFINKLPGYTAQNMTFELMIGFLFIISLIIIAVFLYILTMQKMQNYAVMRAQGIPAKTLVAATIGQAVILVVTGAVIGLLLMELTILMMPKSVPMDFTPAIMLAGVGGMLLMGIIGSLIPVRSILKVDPVKAIGE